MMDDQRLNAAIDKGMRKVQRRRMTVRTTWILAAVLCLAIGGVFADDLYRSVDWRGNRVSIEDEYEPDPTSEPTPPPPDVVAKRDEIEAWIEERIAQKPDLDYYYFDYGDGTGQIGNSMVTTAEEGIALIERSGMKVPSWMPDGYQPMRAQLHFYHTPETYDLLQYIGTEDGPHGASVRMYRNDPKVKDQIVQYSLYYKNAQGKHITVYADRTAKDSTNQFGMQENVEFNVLKIEGMDEACGYIYHDEGHADVFAEQKMSKPIEFVMNDEDKEQSHATELGIDKLAKVIYSIRGEAIAQTELIKMMETLG